MSVLGLQWASTIRNKVMADRMRVPHKRVVFLGMCESCFVVLAVRIKVLPEKKEKRRKRMLTEEKLPI